MFSAASSTRSIHRIYRADFFENLPVSLGLFRLNLALESGGKNMTSQQNAEEAIFKAAIRLKAPAEQAEYLDKACGDNAALRARIDALLS